MFLIKIVYALKEISEKFRLIQSRRNNCTAFHLFFQSKLMTVSKSSKKGMQFLQCSSLAVNNKDDSSVSSVKSWLYNPLPPPERQEHIDPPDWSTALWENSVDTWHSRVSWGLLHQSSQNRTFHHITAHPITLQCPHTQSPQPKDTEKCRKLHAYTVKSN